MMLKDAYSQQINTIVVTCTSNLALLGARASMAETNSLNIQTVVIPCDSCDYLHAVTCLQLVLQPVLQGRTHSGICQHPRPVQH